MHRVATEHVAYMLNEAGSQTVSVFAAEKGLLGTKHLASSN